MHFQKSHVSFPNHSTPSGAQCVPQTQLQFNLNSYKDGAVPQKPKPIIIEKLLPYPSRPVQFETSLMKDQSNIPETMLSSEKLAFAVQLAKMDIRKLKNMLHTENTDVAMENVIPVIKCTKKKTSNESEKLKKKVNEKNQKKEVNKEPQRHVLHLYPEPKEAKGPGAPMKSQSSKKMKPPAIVVPAAPAVAERTTNKDNEMKRLRNDLKRYSYALDTVVQRLNQEKFVDVMNDEETRKERQRDIIRAEEQRNRSARTLYMLQRKVEDLRNELSASKSNVKQTKKSQYTTKLASAHRAAVKALQTFVNHAPLYYSTSGKFPPMYKALALLIQQLTSLSTDNLLAAETETMETIEDLIESLSKVNEQKQPIIHDGTKKKKSSKSLPVKQVDAKKQYLDHRIDWLKKKADELNIKSFQGEATPERASSLKHAIQSLKDDEISIDKKQASPLPRPVLKGKKVKSSVLLPNDLKKRRLKIPSRPYHAVPPGNMNYAAATVISKIREKPPLERREKTPPSSPKKSVVFTDEEPSTPKKRDQKIIEEARLLLSPSQQKKSVSVDLSPSYSEIEEHVEGRRTPTKIKQMEKEINREKWLEQRKSNEISKLDAIEKMNTNWLNKLKKEIAHSNHLVQYAEDKIKERLKPLLDKAEVISQDEARREEQYQTSVNKRLGNIASEKAMSEGERLAEYILDDLIQEAAIDIQKIEVDEHAEMEAAFMLDRGNLETVVERLETFEIEEEKIRRHWKKVQYSELDSNNNASNLSEKKKDCLNDSYTEARSVVFTAPLNKRKPPPIPEHDDEAKPSSSYEISIPDAQLNTILLFKQRFENFLNKSIHNSWDAHPHDVLDELSEHILDELLDNVADELNENCNKFVDDIYEKEFLNVP